mmetsp:Transcript_19911/g.37465  ORF Transcript_19911/g.37465 Transcript_19911/m.37465 type:complete len:236 (+) Transcript_19911:795-1502(+)
MPFKAPPKNNSNKAWVRFIISFSTQVGQLMSPLCANPSKHSIKPSQAGWHSGERRSQTAFSVSLTGGVGSTDGHTSAQSTPMSGTPSPTHPHRSLAFDAQDGQHSLKAHITFDIPPCVASSHVAGKASGIGGASNESRKQSQSGPAEDEKQATTPVTTSLPGGFVHVSGRALRKGEREPMSKPASTEGRISAAGAAARRRWRAAVPRVRSADIERVSNVALSLLAEERPYLLCWS